MPEETRDDHVAAALAAEGQAMPADDFSCPVVMTGGCTYFTDGVHRCCTAPLGDPQHGMPGHPHSCMCRVAWSVVQRRLASMQDELLELALNDEVGPARTRHRQPTSSECYAVSSFVISEFNRIDDQIKNIPWWQINRRRQARRKYRAFGTTHHVIHNYVYPSEES
ncbi:hypothetical protein [Lentzea cavernae]|uniref:Uncharacterized protein n=1 Tax=Lentzea cavernae TaxID=2020703 RepID=A0ABQ3MSS2_9PSEU|nr:hypothetical protein [Lentzea cavernae]GHH57842.1 hypothetical protein GCM10017774_78220 [Lentzea cavernae]